MSAAKGTAIGGTFVLTASDGPVSDYTIKVPTVDPGGLVITVVLSIKA